MRSFVVICLVVAACTAYQHAPAGKERPLAAALFTVADASPSARERADIALDRLAASVNALHRTGAGAGDALRIAVFERAGFAREVDDHALEFVFLPSVLAKKRGSCVGLGTLYLALAERLGWRMHGVMMPGHFFVRLDDASGGHNLELLHGGHEEPDAWYRKRFPIPGGRAREYGRPLSRDEVIAVIQYNTGNDLRQKSHLSEAQRAFANARDRFPDFAEAHASVGMIDHLLGALEQAEANYRAALKVNPNLPGVAQNLELLERERLGN